MGDGGLILSPILLLSGLSVIIILGLMVYIIFFNRNKEE
jgi:hypothetical protein